MQTYDYVPPRIGKTANTLPGKSPPAKGKPMPKGIVNRAKHKKGCK